MNHANSSINVMPGIGHVVLGPLGRVAGDSRARLAHQLLEAQVVEHDLAQHACYLRLDLGGSLCARHRVRGTVARHATPGQRRSDDLLLDGDAARSGAARHRRPRPPRSTSGTPAANVRTLRPDDEHPVVRDVRVDGQSRRRRGHRRQVRRLHAGAVHARRSARRGRPAHARSRSADSPPAPGCQAMCAWGGRDHDLEPGNAGTVAGQLTPVIISRQTSA